MGYEYQHYKQYLVYCDDCGKLLNNDKPMDWIDIEVNLEFEGWIKDGDECLCPCCQKMTKE